MEEAVEQVLSYKKYKKKAMISLQGSALLEFYKRERLQEVGIARGISLFTSPNWAITCWTKTTLLRCFCKSFDLDTCLHLSTVSDGWLHRLRAPTI